MTLPAVSKHLRVLERAGPPCAPRARRLVSSLLPRGSSARGAPSRFLARYQPFWEHTLDTELARYVEKPAPKHPAKKEGPQDMTGGVALVVRRTIRASAERLVEAGTRPEHLRAWWGPRPVDLLRRRGRPPRGRLLSHRQRAPGGGTLVIHGEFREIERPSKLVYTWRMGQGATAEASLVTVRFEARGDATEVVIVHGERPRRGGARLPREGLGRLPETRWRPSPMSPAVLRQAGRDSSGRLTPRAGSVQRARGASSLPPDLARCGRARAAPGLFDHTQRSKTVMGSASFEGKVVLVTGANSGIGEDSGRPLLRGRSEGVYGMARRKESLEAARTKASAHPLGCSRTSPTPPR